MSLTRKQRTTEKNLAARRANARHSHGPVTPAGKAQSAAAKLVHGFYSQSQNEAMIALGEDPKKHRALLRSLVEDLQPRPGMQSEVVLQICQALWRMNRAARIQDGLAVKRVHKGKQVELMAAGPRFVQIHQTYDRICALCRRMNNPDPPPSREEIEGLIGAFENNTPEEIRTVFPLYRAYWEAAWKVSTLVDGSGASETATAEAEKEKAAARAAVDAVLQPLFWHYFQTDNLLLEEVDRVASPENVAALMAPQDKASLVMQKVEDSNLRRLWRLTRIFTMIKRQGGGAEISESGD